jgi:hypothetical protein
MRLIIDAPHNRMSEAVMIFNTLHDADQQPIGMHYAKSYGQTFVGVYNITWAIWRTKRGFSIRYLGHEEGGE